MHKCQIMVLRKCIQFSGKYAQKIINISSNSVSTNAIRFKLDKKKTDLRHQRGVRKKFCKLRQRKRNAQQQQYKVVFNVDKIDNQVVKCFKTIIITNTTPRITTTVSNCFYNNERLTCWSSRKKTQRTIDNPLSNNGSYLRKSARLKQQHQQYPQKNHQKQHPQQQQQQHEKRYEKQHEQHWQHEKQQEEKQQQEQQQEKIHQPKHLQIVRLYARNGVQLRRRRKRRFFINLYSQPFYKLKAIKSTLTHNTTSSFPSSSTSSLLLTLSSSSSTTTTLPSIMLKYDKERTTTINKTSKTSAKSTISTFLSNERTVIEKPQQHGYPATQQHIEKLQGNRKFLNSSSALLYLWTGSLTWRLFLTSLIAMTTSATTTRLMALLIANMRAATAMPRLFQRQLSQCCYSSCWHIISELNKYSWIFLLIYLHLSAKGEYLLPR